MVVVISTFVSYDCIYLFLFHYMLFYILLFFLYHIKNETLCLENFWINYLVLILWKVLQNLVDLWRNSYVS